MAETFALEGICVFFEGELGEGGDAGEFVRRKQADGFLYESHYSFEAAVDLSPQASVVELKVAESLGWRNGPAAIDSVVVVWLEEIASCFEVFEDEGVDRVLAESTKYGRVPGFGCYLL